MERQYEVNFKGMVLKHPSWKARIIKIHSKDMDMWTIKLY